MLPGWFRWVFLLVLGYMLYSASQMSHSPVVQTANSPTVPAITAEKYPALAQATDVERWKRTLNPEYAAVMNCSLDTPKAKDALRFSVIEQSEGSGDGANCGDTITVALSVWNATGGKAYSGELTLALGSRELAAGLDTGLLGMRVDGVRMLVLPPYAIARGKKPSEVKAAVNALPQGKLAVVTAQRLK